MEIDSSQSMDGENDVKILRYARDSFKKCEYKEFKFQATGFESLGGQINYSNAIEVCCQLNLFSCQ